MLKKIIRSVVILTIVGLLCSEAVLGEEASAKTEYEAARDFFEELRTEADKCIALGCGPASLCSDDSKGKLKCECIDGYVKDGNGFCVPDGCVGITCGTNSTCVGYSAIQNNNSERTPFDFDLCECDYGFVRASYGIEEKCVLDRDFDETRLVVLNEEECEYTGVCNIRLELEQPYENLDKNRTSSFIFSISESASGIGRNIFSGTLEDCLDDGICQSINAQYVDFQLIFYEAGERDISVELYDNSEYWHARETVTNTSAETGCYGVKCASGYCEDVNGSGRCSQNYEFPYENEKSEPEQLRSGSLPNAEIHYKFDDTGDSDFYDCDLSYTNNNSVEICGQNTSKPISVKPWWYLSNYWDTTIDVNVTRSEKTLENVYFSIYFSHSSLSNISVILKSPAGTEKVFNGNSYNLGNLVAGVFISEFAGENPIGTWKIIVRNSSSTAGTIYHAGFVFVSNTWIVHDDSGNNRHATYNGSGLGKSGKINYSIKFNGTSDIVNSFYIIPENFTVSFWVNRNSVNQSNKTLFIASRSASNYIRAFLAQDNGTSNHLKVQINGLSTPAFFSIDSGWTHVILSFRKSGSTTVVSAYKNGRKMSDDSILNTVANTTNNVSWELGTDVLAFPKSPTYFSGYMDDFRIYNKVLNRCERDEVYSYNCANGRRNGYNTSSVTSCFSSSGSYCGDGMVTGNETCDMGQQSSSEGCSSSCALQSGYYWYDSCTENFEGTPAANCTNSGYINWRDPSSWESLDPAASGTVSWDLAKEALKITGYKSIAFKKLIPIDTTSSYYLEYDVMTTNNSNKSLYSGVISYDINFNQLPGHSGTYDYFNDDNNQFDAGVWYYRKNAKINGNPRTGESSSQSDRDKWHTGTRYARVLLMANYNQTNSQVTYIKNLKFYPGAGVECSQQSQVVPCTGLPSNASWNTVSNILQSYDGSAWNPNQAGSYSETPSTTECKFVCNSGYLWINSACINERQQACSGLPSNASWNTASSIHQTWNGSVWLPSDEGVYNATPSTTECRFICNSGYVWDANTETCVDVDECAEETYDCPDYSICVNGVGNYTCDCISGYELDILTQSCVPVCGDGRWMSNEECDSELDFTKNCRDLDSDYKSSSYASCGSSCTWDESTCEHVCTGTTCGLVWAATAGGTDTVINCLADGTCGSEITCSSTGELPEVECICPEGFHLEMPSSATTVYVDPTSPIHPLSTPHEICVSNVRKVQCPASDMPQYSEWSDQVNNGIATLTWDENNKNYGVLQQDNSFISLEEACEWSCSEGFTEETSIGLHFTHADFWLSWDAQKERPLYERMEPYFTKLSAMGNNQNAESVQRIVYDALDSDIQARLQQSYECDDNSPLDTVCEDMTWRVMSSMTRLVNSNIPLITYDSSTETFSASDAASVLTDETRQLIKDLPSNIIVLPGRIHSGVALVNRRIIEDAMNRMATHTVRRGYKAGDRMCVNRRIDDCTKDSVGFLDFKLVDKNNKTYIMPESYYYKYSENLVQPVVSSYINGEWIVPLCPWSCKPGAQRSVASSTHCEPAGQLNIPDNNLKKCANRAVAAMNSNENLTFLQWIKEVCAKENDISLLNGVCTVVNGIYDLESLINAILPAQYEFVLVTPPAEDDPVYMADAQLLKSMDCSYATLNDGDLNGINSLSNYITNLEGIQYFISLETLSLDGQAVSMLDPLGAMTSTGFIEEPISLFLGQNNAQISNGATVNIRKFEIIPDVEGECGEGYLQVFDTIVEQYSFDSDDKEWNQKTDGETLYSDAAVYKPNSYVPQYRRTCMDEDYLVDGSYPGFIDVKNCSAGSSLGIIIETINGPSHKTAMICENDGLIPYARFRETLESEQNVWPLRKIAVAEIGLVRTDRMVDKDLGRFFFTSEVDYSGQFVVPYYTARLSNAQNECGSDEWAYILTFKGDVIDAHNSVRLTDFDDSNSNFPAEKEVVVCADAATGELPNLLFQNSGFAAYELRLATPKIKGLKSLILSHNTQISNTWFNHIKSITPLIYLPLLEYFSLEGSSVVDENDVEHPFIYRNITPLIHNHSMKWLDLGGNMIQEDLGSDNDSLIGFTEDYFYDNPTLTTRSGSLRALRNMTKLKSFSAPYANISYFNQRLDTVHRQCSCGDVKSYKTPKSIVIKPNGASIDLSEAEYTFDFNPEYDPGSGENMVLTPNVSFNINESLSSGTNYVYLTIEYEADNDASYTGTLKYKLNKIGSETTVTFEEAYSDFDETVSHNNTTKKALKVRVANITASYSNESPIKSISVDFTVQIGGGTECEVNMADADTDLCGCNKFTGKCDGKKWYPGTLSEQWPLLEYLNLNGNPMRNHVLSIQHKDSRIGNTVTTCSEDTGMVFVGKYDGISSFKHLKGLFLHGVKEIRDDEIVDYATEDYGCDVSQDRLFNVIPQLHELEYADISGTLGVPDTSNPANNIYSEMPDFSNAKLKELDVSENLVMSDASVAKSLSNQHDMEYLNIGKIKIHGTSAGQKLASIDFVYGMQNLQYLDISGNSIDENDFNKLPLNHFPRLEHLGISNNSVTKLRWLASTPYLRYLDISGNRTEEIEQISYLKDLEELNIEGHCIVDQNGLADTARISAAVVPSVTVAGAAAAALNCTYTPVDPSCGNGFREENEVCDSEYKLCRDITGYESYRGYCYCNNECNGWEHEYGDSDEDYDDYDYDEDDYDNENPDVDSDLICKNGTAMTDSYGNPFCLCNAGYHLQGERCVRDAVQSMPYGSADTIRDEAGTIGNQNDLHFVANWRLHNDDDELPDQDTEIPDNDIPQIAEIQALYSCSYPTMDNCFSESYQRDRCGILYRGVCRDMMDFCTFVGGQCCIPEKDGSGNLLNVCKPQSLSICQQSGGKCSRKDTLKDNSAYLGCHFNANGACGSYVSDCVQDITRISCSTDSDCGCSKGSGHCFYQCMDTGNDRQCVGIACSSSNSNLIFDESQCSIVTDEDGAREICVSRYIADQITLLGSDGNPCFGYPVEVSLEFDENNNLQEKTSCVMPSPMLKFSDECSQSFVGCLNNLQARIHNLVRFNTDKLKEASDPRLSLECGKDDISKGDAAYCGAYSRDGSGSSDKFEAETSTYGDGLTDAGGYECIIPEFAKIYGIILETPSICNMRSVTIPQHTTSNQEGGQNE